MRGSSLREHQRIVSKTNSKFQGRHEIHEAPPRFDQVVLDQTEELDAELIPGPPPGRPSRPSFCRPMMQQVQQQPPLQTQQAKTVEPDASDEETEEGTEEEPSPDVLIQSAITPELCNSSVQFPGKTNTKSSHLTEMLEFDCTSFNSRRPFLQKAVQLLASAERLLLPLVDACDEVHRSQDRLRAICRALEEDLAVVSATSVEERLHVLLKQHSRCISDCADVEKRCEEEEKEVRELRRQVAEMERSVYSNQTKPTPLARADSNTRKLETLGSLDSSKSQNLSSLSSLTLSVSVKGVHGPKSDDGITCNACGDELAADDISEATVPATRSPSKRLMAVKIAIQRRCEAAQTSYEVLLAESVELDQLLTTSREEMQRAIFAGRLQEEQQEEAAEEVDRACTTIKLLREVELASGRKAATPSEQAKLAYEIAVTRPAAPHNISALGGSIAAGSEAQLLDLEEYRLSRQKDIEKADNDFQQFRLLRMFELEAMKKKFTDERMRQQEEIATLEAEIKVLKQKLAETRSSVTGALDQQKAHREQRCADAQRGLQERLRSVQAEERRRQDVLRSELVEATKAQRELVALTRQRLEVQVATVRAECRRKLQHTAAMHEQTLLEERRLLQEAKERKDKLTKRLHFLKESLRSHVARSGVYVRSLDLPLRKKLEAIVPQLASLIA